MADIKVTASVRLRKEESGFFIHASLDAELAGAREQQAESLVAKAHTICPCSKATRGNIAVKVLANGEGFELWVPLVQFREVFYTQRVPTCLIKRHIERLGQLNVSQ
jgi:hypothetical protein